MSANLGTKCVNFEDLDVVFACTQKNLGSAGLTVVIVRRSVHGGSKCFPTILDYHSAVSQSSMKNTSMCFRYT
jgi:phosphoserine aminotransferase